MLTGTDSPLTSLNWAFRQRPFTTSEAMSWCDALNKRCGLCVTYAGLLSFLLSQVSHVSHVHSGTDPIVYYFN